MTDPRQAGQHQVHAADLQALHQRQLPALQTIQAELSHGVSGLQIREGTATRLYGWYGLNALADLHATAVQALVQERDFSAQVLAQDAIRQAVNLLYVLGDPGGDRLTGLLRHHLDAQRSRFEAWRATAPEEPMPEAQLTELALQCLQSPWYADAPAWPPLDARAKAAGVAAWVHPVLANAADAEQTLAQEAMNFLNCERGALPERQAAHAYRTARCASDARYTENVALSMFARALQEMAVVLLDKVAATIAGAAIERLDGLLVEHQQLMQAHQSDQNVYIKVH